MCNLIKQFSLLGLSLLDSFFSFFLLFLFVFFTNFSVNSAKLQHYKMLLKDCLCAVCSWNMYLSLKDLYQNLSIFFLEYFTLLYLKNKPRVSLFGVKIMTVQLFLGFGLITFWSQDHCVPNKRLDHCLD